MTVAKAVASETQMMRDTARAALESNPGDQAQLEATLRQLMVDAYSTGAHAAGQQIPGTTATLAGIGETDWAAWSPGDPAAAALTTNGGLADLLDAADIRIKGITGSLLDQLGNRIGDGLAGGDSVDSIARNVSDIVSDPSRAEMIAHTETARATTAATLDTYGINGVTEWDWVVADDPCPECEDQESQNPHPLRDTDQPPLHPRCRCAIAPVVDSMQTLPGEGISDEALAGAEEEAASILGNAAEDLTALTVDELGERLSNANDDQMQSILDELDRRDAETEALLTANNPADDPAESEYERLLAAGTDPERAFEQAYGPTTDQQRRDIASAALRADGYTGHGFRDLAEAKYADMADEAYLDAEKVTRGVLLNDAGRAADINPRSLFTGTEARARKYASDELRSYWQQHGRLTVDDVKSGLLGGKGRSLGTEYWA